ncbi:MULTISPECIES: phosphatase PAP2 family protein [unclassified Arsukibacterium]|uniref:phosphatase PAP2 family protein n=1 Tax=unclassified Arsukibacterium TaxID=2635278 RepID=UPI000C425598|nr:MULTISPECIES: phosphatase PAP2 family protein [unclassified Arsukibacterium]MAB17880.1 phosphatase PAP2 family protein [Roseobacter sp.]MBM33370.1 phosphatase PAP2 family protein [Rheinheimera sp.]HAW92519.1 phosphatase PAP2 family protein [Candidatus Azambacteria bacterium]|tara:strand:+ start:5374 stop:5910 length:537 start_codon:yes stop_codon:yes gene_type:complete
MNTLQKLTLLDTRLFFQVNLIGQLPSVRKLSLGLSRCGDGPLYLIIALLLWQFDHSKGSPFVQHALLAFAIELPLYLLLKNAIQRERPSGSQQHGWAPAIRPSDRFSFPSGHTAAAFMFAWLLAAYYPEFSFYYLLLASGIGLSRVLLGVHYPTDILAGASLGSVIALAVLQSALFIF